MRKYSKILAAILVTIAAGYAFSARAATFPIIGGCGGLNSTDMSTQMGYEVDSRISGVTATNSTMMLWTQRGNGTSGWTRNPNVWTNRGTSPLDFTGASPWNNDASGNPGGYKGGGALISPRHLLMAYHYQLSND